MLRLHSPVGWDKKRSKGAFVNKLGKRSGAKVLKNPTQKHGMVQELMEDEIMNAQKPDMVHILKRQLDPSLEMLKEVIELCPNELWYAESDTPPIWEQVYHTLFWFNEWLRDWSKQIEYPKFHVEEALEMKRPPTGNISKEQIEGYMNKVVEDYKSFLSTVSPESLLQEQVAFNEKWTIADRVLIQIRHIQHHVGYLNSVLRMKKEIPAEWIGFNE